MPNLEILEMRQTCCCVLQRCMDMHGCNCIATFCMKELMLVESKCCKGCSTALHLTLVFPCKWYRCIYSTYVHLLRESSWHGFWPTLLPGCWEHVALRCKAVASDVAESFIVHFFLLHCTSREVATEIFHNMCSGDTASICKPFVLGC